MKNLKYLDYNLIYNKFVLGFGDGETKPEEINYLKLYLTFEALEDGTFTMTLDAKLPTTCVESVSYSVDNGKTWVTTNNVDNEIITITTPIITQGNKVIWKGTAILYCTNTDPYPGSNIGYGYFTSTNNFNVSGNIMSLLYNDDFNDKLTLPERITTGNSAGNFCYLFGKGNCKIISAIDLKLPVTTLSSSCYIGMFYNCTSLTSAPELPATTLTNSCYYNMFYGCTNLVSAPSLPAITLVDNCYSNMFSNCSNLISAPKLPATTLVTNCYSSMFSGCSSLTATPELPAITLASSCYNNMFSGCSSLNNITMLATDTSATYCLNNWVNGVAQTGTFTKAATMNSLPSGADGIPSGWTVVDKV